MKPRTRKEIVKFVLIDLNGAEVDNFDQEYKTTYRGYYSTFFRDVKHNGNIEVIDGKYHVTKSCLEEGNGLWSMNKDRKIEILENSLKRMQSYRTHMLHLKDKLNKIREIV